MAGDTVITVIGNLTADPELRWTQSGAAVADFTVASTPRTYDRNAGEWRDGDTLFMRCSVWRETAENVAESLRKGMRVIVQGRLTQRSYDTQQGERRTVVELQVDEVGPSLRRARAQVTRTAPSGGGGYQSDNRGQQGAPQQGGGHELERRVLRARHGHLAGQHARTLHDDDFFSHGSSFAPGPEAAGHRPSIVHAPSVRRRLQHSAIIEREGPDEAGLHSESRRAGEPRL